MRKIGIFVLATVAVAAVMGSFGLMIHFWAVMAASLGGILVAMTLHECAHGIVALCLGDTTARDEGRLTLNPLAHIDPLGLALPVILHAFGLPIIGWARPVPVRLDRLRNPQRDMALVAVAGPVASLSVALICAATLRAVGADGSKSVIASVGWFFAVTNLAIGLFNCLPFYPMDGGRIVAAALPEKAFRWLSHNEGKAILLVLALIFCGPGIVGAATGFDVGVPAGRAFNSVVETLTGVPDAAWSKSFDRWAADGFMAGRPC